MKSINNFLVNLQKSRDSFEKGYRNQIKGQILCIVKELQKWGTDVPNFCEGKKVSFELIKQYFECDNCELNLSPKQWKRLQCLFYLMKIYPEESFFDIKKTREIGKYDVEFVLNNLVTEVKGIREIDGMLVKTNSYRYELFKSKGVTCTDCGIKGEFFLLEKLVDISNYRDIYHFNLYAMKDNKKILMTVDHIIAKSNGGGDTLDNYQPMCQPCNVKKGNTI